jgi:ATP-dependent Clp protease ATP-binding subunit ClpC
MSNRKCDLCGVPASYRAKVIQNGFRKTKELCEDHYTKFLNISNNSHGTNYQHPSGAMFGNGSLFDEFFAGSRYI